MHENKKKLERDGARIPGDPFPLDPIIDGVK